MSRLFFTILALFFMTLLAATRLYACRHISANDLDICDIHTSIPNFSSKC